MNLFRSKPRDVTTGVFHIGSTCVEAALLHGGEHSTKKVIHSSRASFPFRKKIEFSRYERTMLSAMLEAGMDLQTNGFARLRENFGRVEVPRTVYCFYSSPWYVSQLRTTTLRREKPFVFEPKTLADAAKSEQERFTESLKARHAAQLSGGVSVLDMRPTQITLNGYAISHPFGNHSREASISFFASAMSSELRKQTEDIVLRIFPDSHIISHASVLSQLAAVLGTPQCPDRFLLIEIGGEVTEVSLVTAGAVEDMVSFPVGTNEVARQFGSSDEIAHHRMRLIARKKSGVDDAADSHIKAIDAWREQFLEACKDLGDGRALPRQTVVLIEDEWAYDFKKEIARIVAQELTYSADPFVIAEQSQVSGLDTYAAEEVGASERLLVDTYFVNSDFASLTAFA
jgi:hypothetical protein